ncbi:MAG: hypothetical protein HYW48_07235 [Deltaproteobacteria bacterium]|nr:hypothetical protein [Deltaproteobacteria bacterium]
MTLRAVRRKSVIPHYVSLSSRGLNAGSIFLYYVSLSSRGLNAGSIFLYYVTDVTHPAVFVAENKPAELL